MNYAKQKESYTKDYILYNSIYITFWKRQNCRYGFLGLEVNRRLNYKVATQNNFFKEL